MTKTGTKMDYPWDTSVQELFEEQVEGWTGDVALVHGGGEITYGELNERANRLAHYLGGHGVGPGTPVAFMLERSPEAIMTMLAILKAGGAYVPLDVSYPKSRLGYMLEDSGATLVLTLEDLLKEVREAFPAGTRIICLDSEASAIEKESPSNPGIGGGAEDLAYIMYTSGSTGKPKGVEIPHRGIVRLLFGVDYVDLGPDQTILHMASVSFDAATFEIWGALLHGGRCAVLSSRVPTTDELGEAIRQHGVNTMWLTASLFNLVVDEDPEVLVPLEQLLIGGEALSVSHVRRAYEHLPATQIINGYGPTESTTFTCCYRIPRDLADGVSSVPIGYPIGNTTVHVLDGNLQPVPPGVPGELFIGGDGLARGYRNDEDLTAERFVGDPFSRDPSSRLYRTGDLVRRLTDGSIDFMGRLDDQVKVRGFRIELGEIEFSLGEHSAVTDAVVLARTDMPGASSKEPGTEKQLVAYVVADPRRGTDANELRRFLNDRLPQYMVPSAFVFLPELPLNVNGKIDRAALPAPTQRDLTSSRAFMEPKTHTEIELAAIWCEILGTSRVSRDDDFLELGGHSLDAARVLSRVAGVFQVDLPVFTIFAKTRLREMAAEIEDAQRSGEWATSSSIQPVPRTQDLPLTFSQERVWFIQNMDPENGAYHFQAALRFHGALDVTALERSLSAIISRHEAFRTTFPVVAGRPVQRIHDPEPVVLDVVDLTGRPFEEQDDTFRHAIEVEMQEPFDLEELPLLRWKLFQVGEEEFWLAHVEHHLIHDGWSFNVFVRELLELYQAQITDGPAQLPELPIQFADFATWQREWMDSEAAKEQRAFWERQLEGLPPMLNLPLDKPRPAVQSFRGSSFRWELPVDLCDSIRAFSKAEGSTLFVPLLEALTILLHRYSGQDDVAIGCGIANRRWRETEDLLGMIINNVVVRSDCSGQPTVQELLNRLRGTMLDAVAHQDLPFDSVVEAVQPERDLSHNPLFQVMFGLHDAPMPALEIPGLSLEVIPGLSNGSAKFDLTLIAMPTSSQLPGYAPNADGDGLTILWEYNSDLFERTTVERMAAHYQLILEAIVSDPAQSVGAISLLGEAEGKGLGDLWNDTESSYPRNRRVQELFEEQVEGWTGDVALVHGGGEITYGELNERANRLAHYLGGHGVGPGTPVAFMLERSPEAIMTMLAILKAGGAYVPLDVSYPKSRLGYMLEDSGATLVLTLEDLLKEVREAFPAGTRIICLDSEASAIEKESPSNPGIGGGAEDLAYIMYTSGSTGKPKGVEIPHRGIVRLLFGVDYVDLGPDQTILHMASVSFDAATFEIWGALLHGGRCAVLSSRVPTTDELGEAIRQHGVNTMWLTASLFNLVVDEDPEVLVPLEQLLIGGEALSVSHVRRAYEHLPATQIINGYGPTESTTFTCCYRIPRDLADGVSSVPIGYPIGNTTVHVLDGNLQPVPPGVPGELFIGGDGLARGYRNDEDLTAERFVGDPFSRDPSSRLYRTGDLVRRLTDGSIDFMGRLDDQVKVRGFRIELGEIERALSAHNGVRSAFVMLRDDSAAGCSYGSGSEKQIAAYVIPAEEDDLLIEEDLRAFLKEELPEYMVPSAFVAMKEFPLTANGKIDRRALPFPTRETRVPEQSYTVPGTAIERTISEVWSEVLGLERVGIHDNFFDLGGNSLLMMQVRNRLRDRLNADLSIVNLFSHPTVHGFAGLVAEQSPEEGAPS